MNGFTETDLGNVSFNPCGEYSAEKTYEYLDTVAMYGGSYLCVAETAKGISPVENTTTETWQCVAERGQDGTDGLPGRDGTDGIDGTDGKSAYQSAVEGGFQGTEEDFKNGLANTVSKTEFTNALAGKADKTEIPTELPTPHNLTFTGAATGEFNGSQPLNIEIPEAKEYILPTATPDILGGVMPVAKTPTMGQEVGSDEQGRLFTEQSIKRINPFDLSSWPKEPLIDFVSEEAVTQIGITTLTDGAPILGLNLKECLVEVYIPYDSENANILPAIISFGAFGGNSLIRIDGFIARRSDCQNLFYYSFNETDFIEKVPLLQHVDYINRLLNVQVANIPIAGFGIKTGGYQLPIGTIIKMWGR